jgi:hypothetical protein
MRPTPRLTRFSLLIPLLAIALMPATAPAAPDRAASQVPTADSVNASSAPPLYQSSVTDSTIHPTLVPFLRADQVRQELRLAALHARTDSLAQGVRDSLAADSVRADSVAAYRLAFATARTPRPRGAEIALTMAGGVLLFANSVARFDVDAGGYHDTWRSPDKLLHSALGYTITDGCTALGGRRWVCAPLVAVLGYGWELSQAQAVGRGHGFVSNRDAWAVAGGAAVNALLHTARHR